MPKFNVGDFVQCYVNYDFTYRYGIIKKVTEEGYLVAFYHCENCNRYVRDFDYSISFEHVTDGNEAIQKEINEKEMQLNNLKMLKGSERTLNKLEDNKDGKFVDII